MNASRKRYFRNDADKYNFLRSLKSGFRRMFDNARRFAWMQAFMLEKRHEFLQGDGVTTAKGDWEKLAAIDQAEMFGYWQALEDSLLDSLEFRYLINGKWYTPTEVCNRVDGTDPARDIPSPCTNAHYVFTVNTESGPEYRIWS